MSALTKKERDGLEEVFMSIHSNSHKLEKIKEISLLIISKKNYFFAKKLIEKAKIGLKTTKIIHFFNIKQKKKKNLR